MEMEMEVVEAVLEAVVELDRIAERYFTVNL